VTWDSTVLPYGVFSVGGGAPRIGVAVRSSVLDLSVLLGHEWAAPSLNGFLAQGRSRWTEVHREIRSMVADLDRTLIRHRVLHHDPGSPALLHPAAAVTMHLPFEVADYVDFYASEEHATNLGRIFRPDSEPLLPNWKHLPVGYHGRAGTVVVSGTDVRRPCGLRAPAPSYGPSSKLDVEVELGFVVGVGSELGTPVSTRDFEEHVFGVVLVNDWSARDIQAYEYVPLGPFLGKSFATSISPWVVPLDVLPRVAAPAQDPPVADYLRTDSDWAFDLTLELELNGTVLSRPPYAGMYWTAPQMLAHLTANGASVRTGDLFASGTVSGPSDVGSLIELTWNGRDGAFLQDGDVATISARTSDGRWLGSVTGRIVP
jgi:fumarylacetoacetase